MRPSPILWNLHSNDKRCKNEIIWGREGEEHLLIMITKSNFTPLISNSK